MISIAPGIEQHDLYEWNGAMEMANLIKSMPDFRVRVETEGIQIRSDRTGEQNRILWDHRDAASNIFQTNRFDIDTIDENLAMNKDAHTEQSLCQGALASTGSAHNTNLLSRFDNTGEMVENHWTELLMSMGHGNVFENDSSVVRPMYRGSVHDWRSRRHRFLVKFTVLENTFDGCHLCFHFYRLPLEEE